MRLTENYLELMKPTEAPVRDHAKKRYHFLRYPGTHLPAEGVLYVYQIMFQTLQKVKTVGYLKNDAGNAKGA